MMDEWIKIKSGSLVRIINEMEILRANCKQMETTVSDYQNRIGILQEKLKSAELIIHELSHENAEVNK